MGVLVSKRGVGALGWGSVAGVGGRDVVGVGGTGVGGLGGGGAQGACRGTCRMTDALPITKRSTPGGKLRGGEAQAGAGISITCILMQFPLPLTTAQL